MSSIQTPMGEFEWSQTVTPKISAKLRTPSLEKSISRSRSISSVEEADIATKVISNLMPSYLQSNNSVDAELSIMEPLQPGQFAVAAFCTNDDISPAKETEEVTTPQRNNLAVNPTILEKALQDSYLQNLIGDHVGQTLPDETYTQLDEVISCLSQVETLKIKIAALEHSSNQIKITNHNQSIEIKYLKIDSDERIRYLERSIASIQRNSHMDIQELNSQVMKLEKEITQFQQYNRRESIEISGFPENVPQKDLEGIIIGILRRIGVWGLDSYEVTACHRLMRKIGDEITQRVIIRFTNRKRAHESLSGRKYLKDTIWEYPGIYIHESLCHKYKDLYENCLQLKSEGKVKKMWTYKGTVHIKKSDNYHEIPKKIYNQSDIDRFIRNMPG